MNTDLLNLANDTLASKMRLLAGTQYHSQPTPEIHLNQRGRIAGAAVLQNNIIRLQPKLFAQNVDYFLSDVIPHELAHLVVFHHFGKVRPHGREWQHVMQDVFAVPAQVKHQLDVTTIGIKSYEYYCACGSMLLSATRHNRIIAKKQVYHCRRCRQALVASADVT
ncbi:SprT family zinc-dependent metalloprotease [Glaciecola sp. XM2]|jgi:SprT protein|uniref:SprT family zinc-dependent metalloprotease n=1 Tax=Glaciecola sp. XM2 TaxID=1914931 RepID=UPI001BDF1DC5|nr:SprT family zinc-dependent metalloprotease [Glaciecola sp. XM2]MBT1449375.1 SprT family zinc-dependent metalloprotease [Glaciecola sp. XM2]